MSERKIKRRFYKQEKIRTAKQVGRIRAIINEVLEEDFGRKLYNLKHDDELRLLTFFAWRDRYKVDIKWMLKILIEIWSKKFARFRIRSAIGCRVATLVGKKSEEIIRERIYREFPHGENKSEWKQRSRTHILEDLENGKRSKHKGYMGKSSKYKSIIEAPNAEEFIKQYRRELKWKISKNKLNHHQSNQLKEIKIKCFRQNPWQE